jgi:transcription-repair coupling factor (superfamily II helicase)
MSEDASKRLLAIKEFTQFGAGFKIALRDLEIRGAGNMLGLSQHGHIGNVGYEMYLRLLNEVVLEKKGLSGQKQTDCVVDIGVDAYIPDEYIQSSEQRIEIYKRIAAISNQEQAMDVKDELLDRYGEIPSPVLNLIDISLIRNLASDKKIREINQNNENIIFYLEDTDSDALSLVGSEYAGGFLYGAGKKPHFIVKNKKKRKPTDFF